MLPSAQQMRERTEAARAEKERKAEEVRYQRALRELEPLLGKRFTEASDKGESSFSFESGTAEETATTLRAAEKLLEGKGFKITGGSGGWSGHLVTISW